MARPRPMSAKKHQIYFKFMNDEDDFYTRKTSLRLKGFDYSSRRVYFVTIVAEDRRNLFHNKEFAKEVVDCLLNLREEMKFNLYGYCLMPNHLHALIGIGESEKDSGKICGAFKSLTTRIYWRYGEGKLWQREFHDHIVRNETDFFRVFKIYERKSFEEEIGELGICRAS